MKDDKEKIKEKIRLLLNLANNKAATEGEVQAAMAKVNKLMHDYMLSIDDIEEAKEEFTCISKVYNWRKKQAICRSVDTIICKLFDCECFYNRYNKNTTIFGVELDVDTVFYMLDLCYDALDNSFKKFTRTKEYSINLMFYSKAVIKNDFIKGFCMSIIRTAKTLIKEKEEFNNKQHSENSTCTAIIVLKNQLVESEYDRMKNNKGLKIKCSKSSIRGITSEDALKVGSSEGSKVSLRKAINEHRDLIESK